MSVQAVANQNARPVDLLLPRLEGVKQTKPGAWIAQCPAHEDKHPSLSVRECSDGTLLLHDFAGCDAVSILAAVGLSLSDLFPDRGKPRTAMAKRERREAWQQSGWRAALNVLAFESTIVEIAAHDLAKGNSLNEVDHERLITACQRIHEARGVLS